MGKTFSNPAADFLPISKKVPEVQKPVITTDDNVEKQTKEEVKPEKTVSEARKGKITKITIEIDYEDSLKINRIVDAYKLMDPETKYSKKWFLTKSIKEAIEKSMDDLDIKL